jgi:hypothetical protein
MHGHATSRDHMASLAVRSFGRCFAGHWEGLPAFIISLAKTVSFSQEAAVVVKAVFAVIPRRKTG